MDELGRIKVKLPVAGPDDVSRTGPGWLRPGAGKDYGVMWMPQVGDEVLVAFEHGDIDYPIVLGGLWNGKDISPVRLRRGPRLRARSPTAASPRGRATRSSFFESSSESKIHLLTANGKVSIELDDKNEVIKVETTGKLVVDAKQDVEIKAGGSMKLEASGQMKIKGATVAIN